MTPLLGLVVSLMIGSGLSLSAEPPFPLLPVTFILGPGLLVVSGRLAWAGHSRPAAVVAMAGALLCGITQARVAELRAWHPPGIDVADLERRSVAGALAFVEGVLRHDAAPTSFGAALDLHVDVVEIDAVGLPTAIGMRLSVGGAQVADALNEWTRGRRIRAPVSALRRPLPYRNFDVPDAEVALSRRRVRMFGSVKSASLVEWRAGPWWEEVAARVRARVRNAVRDASSNSMTSAVIIAILIGDRTGLPADEERRLQEAGTYHVIAISGGNVALWLGAIAWFPRWQRTSVRVGTALLTVALLLFAMCVDGGASVGRASLVAGMWLAARWWDLRTSALQATAGAAALIVLADPLAVHDPGFLLSFGATLALIVLGLRLQAHRRAASGAIEQPAWPRRVFAAAAVVVLATTAVELLLMPIGARWFSLATGVGLIANLFALPAMAVVQGAGVAVVALDACGLIAAARLAGQVAGAGVHVLVGSGTLVDLLPVLVRHMPPPSMVVMLAYYGCLSVCLWATWPVATAFSSWRSLTSPMRTRRWRATLGGTSAMAGALLLALIVWGGPARVRHPPSAWGLERAVQTTAWPRDGWLVLTFIDVGQGDATLMQFPNGRTWLVDAGGEPADSTFDLGARVTAPAIWALGSRRLDRVVLTHGHSDHGGGLPAVFERFSPRELMVGVPVPSEPTDAVVLEAAARHGIRVRELRTRDHFAEGRVSVRVLHPPMPDWERVRVRNDDSVALWLQYGDVGVLLPGDAGIDVEGDWVDQVSAAPIVAMRAGHHGSRSSSGGRLLQHFRPDVLVASAGRGNRFGHPHADVLRRTRQAGADIWRTDEDGAVQVATNGHLLVVRSVTGRQSVITRRPPLARRASRPAMPLPSRRARPRRASRQCPPRVSASTRSDA